MATQNNTIKTRIQLKNDIEANWNKAINFIPKKGEVIIYSAETAQDELPADRMVPHPFSRLKVGDGSTTVTNLPFIDAGTLNGEYEFIEKYNDSTSFPVTGNTEKLYIDLSTNKIYHYINSIGYKLLYKIEYKSVSTINSWSAGRLPRAYVENNIFTVVNGTSPNIGYTNGLVVKDLT